MSDDTIVARYFDMDEHRPLVLTAAADDPERSERNTAEHTKAHGVRATKHRELSYVDRIVQLYVGH